MTPEPMRNPVVKIYGSIAYAPQKPWIMAGTVKENILFFNEY
jgi:ABC-type multidrug transport system fused ATPase/permease subunit